MKGSLKRFTFLDENMEAMRSNFLFRKHFKKLEKEKKKQTKQAASTADNKKQPL